MKMDVWSLSEVSLWRGCALKGTYMQKSIVFPFDVQLNVIYRSLLLAISGWAAEGLTGVFFNDMTDRKCRKIRDH